MKSINIKGKNYIPVNERVKEFRSNPAFEGWNIFSEIVSLTDESVVMKATVVDKDGVIRGVGHAQEFRVASNINKTSYVENCETSAWGRALGCIGIGIDESIATADEVTNAIEAQNAMSKPVTQSNIDALISKCMDKNVPEATILKHYKVKKLEDMNQEQWMNAMRKLDATLPKEA